MDFKNTLELHLESMKRIAIISDIHGNMPALQAVLEDINNRGIKTIFLNNMLD